MCQAWQKMHRKNSPLPCALWIIQQSAISTCHTAPLPAKSNPESFDFCPSFIAKPFIIAAQPYLLQGCITRLIQLFYALGILYLDNMESTKKLFNPVKILSLEMRKQPVRTAKCKKSLDFSACPKRPLRQEPISS